MSSGNKGDNGSVVIPIVGDDSELNKTLNKVRKRTKRETAELRKKRKEAKALRKAQKKNREAQKESQQEKDFRRNAKKRYKKLNPQSKKGGFKSSTMNAQANATQSAQQFQNQAIKSAQAQAKAQAQASQAQARKHAKDMAHQKKMDALHAKAILEDRKRTRQSQEKQRQAQEKMDNLHAKALKENHKRDQEAAYRKAKFQQKEQIARGRAAKKRRAENIKGIRREHSLRTRLNRKRSWTESLQKAKQGGNLASALMGGTLAYGVVGAYRKGQEWVKYQNMLAATSQNREQYDERFAFTQRLADYTGAYAPQLGREYAKFATSNPEDGMSEKVMQEGFGSVVEATTMMGGNAEDLNRAMKAITQMSGKGKVMAEELRGQLGENMAGAFKLFAEGMGLTVKELDKQMSDGKVFSAEALPLFFERLKRFNKEGGGVRDTAVIAQGRANNAMARASGGFMRQGGDNGMINFWNTLTSLAEGFGSVAESLAPLFVSFWRVIAEGANNFSKWLHKLSIDLVLFFDQFVDGDIFKWANDADAGFSKLDETVKNIMAGVGYILATMTAIRAFKFVGAVGSGLMSVAGGLKALTFRGMLAALLPFGAVGAVILAGWLIFEHKDEIISGIKAMFGIETESDARKRMEEHQEKGWWDRLWSGYGLIQQGLDWYRYGDPIVVMVKPSDEQLNATLGIGYKAAFSQP